MVSPGSLAQWHPFADLAELVQASDLIVEARVTQRIGDREIRLHPAQRVPVAFTESVVQIRRALKGDVDGELIVTQLGRDGDVANTYPEFPLLRPGTVVLLFLSDVSEVPAHSQGIARFGVIAPVGAMAVVGDRLISPARGQPVSDLAARTPRLAFEEEIRRIVEAAPAKSRP